MALAISIHDPKFEAKMLAHRADSEMDDADHDLLAAWRKHQGEAIMTEWSWWWAEEACTEYSGCCNTREAAINDALAEGYFDVGHQSIDLIEARCWQDELADDDFVPFADTRNAETLATKVDAAGKRVLA